jgi:large subunit ribosomal protein L23
MELLEVIRRPVITEKSTALQERGKYAFEVARKATKPQVKAAVEKAFTVNVTKVNIITVQPKTKMVRRNRIKTRSWKKAIVTLAKGQQIELFEGV